MSNLSIVGILLQHLPNCSILFIHLRYKRCPIKRRELHSKKSMQSKMASIRFIKREARSIKSSFNKQQIIISGIAILILISQIVTIVRCRYLPSSSGLQRRQDDIDSDSDGDGDELDSNASSPYQNQEDGGGRDGDSYGDNEPGEFARSNQ